MNLFRISQMEQKLKMDNTQIKKDTNKAHYEVGSKIRRTWWNYTRGFTYS